MQRSSSPFGEMLRRHRAEANLTQRELAVRAGLGTRTISDLERGLKRPMVYTIRQLAGALQLEGDERRAFEAAARGEPLPFTSLQREETPTILSTLPAPVAPFVRCSPSFRSMGGGAASFTSGASEYPRARAPGACRRENSRWWEPGFIRAVRWAGHEVVDHEGTLDAVDLSSSETVRSHCN